MQYAPPQRESGMMAGASAGTSAAPSLAGRENAVLAAAATTPRTMAFRGGLIFDRLSRATEESRRKIQEIAWEILESFFYS